MRWLAVTTERGREAAFDLPTAVESGLSVSISDMGLVWAVCTQGRPKTRSSIRLRRRRGSQGRSRTIGLSLAGLEPDSDSNPCNESIAQSACTADANGSQLVRAALPRYAMHII
jgi:hypothetical protein